MKHVTLITRLLLGFVFFGSGLAFFFTNPEVPPGPIAEFFKGMVATGYFLYLLKITETVTGLLLLSGFFVPLALVILAPVILNIFLLHAFVAPSGVPLALVLGGLEIYLSFFSKEYSPVILQLFRKK